MTYYDENNGGISNICAIISEIMAFNGEREPNTRRIRFEDQQTESKNDSNAGLVEQQTISHHYHHHHHQQNNTHQSELVTINGITGILVNKDEIENWRGPIPLNEYPINIDPNPEIIRRKLDGLSQTTAQEISIRYLEPPTPPQPGEIIIQQENPIIPPSAPPIILRQIRTSEVDEEKEVLIYREEPPPMPTNVERKIVKVLAPKIAPPPRVLIVERPPPAVAAKSQSILIERWLAPKQQERRVIFEGSQINALFTGHPLIRNQIIEYDAPKTIVNKHFTDLGVTRMNPDEYKRKYGNALLDWKSLPDFVKSISPPPGLTLASEARSERPLLTGDIEALELVDLDREGLHELKSYLINREVRLAGKYDEPLVTQHRSISVPAKPRYETMESAVHYDTPIRVMTEYHQFSHDTKFQHTPSPPLSAEFSRLTSVEPHKHSSRILNETHHHPHPSTQQTMSINSSMATMTPEYTRREIVSPRYDQPPSPRVNLTQTKQPKPNSFSKNSRRSFKIKAPNFDYAIRTPPARQPRYETEQPKTRAKLRKSKSCCNHRRSFKIKAPEFESFRRKGGETNAPMRMETTTQQSSPVQPIWMPQNEQTNVQPSFSQRIQQTTNDAAKRIKGRVDAQPITVPTNRRRWYPTVIAPYI